MQINNLKNLYLNANNKMHYIKKLYNFFLLCCSYRQARSKKILIIVDIDNGILKKNNNKFKFQLFNNKKIFF